MLDYTNAEFLNQSCYMFYNNITVLGFLLREVAAGLLTGVIADKATETVIHK